jgi:pentatricopeptide repeat protein
MKRYSSVLLVTALLVPALAQAQKKPSNNMHTRSADVYLGQAQQAQVNADKKELLQKALAAALEGAESDPGNPKPWFQAGIAYVRLGDLAGADSAFDKAEQMYPEYAEEIDPERLNAWITSYNAGVQALQGGDAAKAISSFETANAIYAKRPEAMVLLGSLYMQEGDAAKAEKTFVNALSVLRSPARQGLKPEEAAAWAEDELTVALRLSTLYADQDRNDEAIKVYRDLLTSQPDNPMARANLAVVLARAGKTDEAVAMYREMLKKQDVPEATLFNVGVGLFRAEQYADAAAAFRRAAELNPYSQETLYNLAQTLLAHSGALEKQQPAPTAELKKLYEEMRTVSQKLHDIDPANRNVIMMVAQSQRSLSELAGQTPEGEQLRKGVLATLEKADALAFEVSDISVAPGETEVQITGKVTNLKGTAGTPVRLKFIILNRQGAELTTEEISVSLPATEESERFNARVKVPEGAAAWKYTVVGS